MEETHHVNLRIVCAPINPIETSSDMPLHFTGSCTQGCKLDRNRLEIFVAGAMNRDPQLRHRKYFVPAQHPRTRVTPAHSWAFKLSKTPPEFRGAPCLGEDNYYVCTQILGISDSEFLKLAEEGVLE